MPPPSVWILLMILPVPLCRGAPKCFPFEADFEAKCDSLGGVIEGGQCFYGLIDRLGTWDEVWTMCRADGGVLAQLHTEREYRKVFDYVQSTFANSAIEPESTLYAFVTAYKDQRGLSSTATCRNEITAQWYYNETTPIADLNRAKSYAKYNDCWDIRPMITGPRCYSLSWTDDDCESGWTIAQLGWYPVCQITNVNQNFSRSGYCMTEPEVEKISGQTADDCAYECAQRACCRSFNFDQGSSECKLFARSILDCQDDPSKCPLNGPETSVCVHYNYVP